MCLRAAADESNAFRKVCCHNNIAKVVASFNVKLDWILVTEHAEVVVACSHDQSIDAFQLVGLRVFAADRRSAARLAWRRAGWLADRLAYWLAWCRACWLAWLWAYGFAYRLAGSRWARWLAGRRA